MKYLILLFISITSVNSYAQKAAIVGAPKGDTFSVAKKIIFVDAEQPCGRLLSATRDSKDFINAKCSNGEQYLVGVFKNAPMKNGSRQDVPVAMKCSLAKSMFGVVCP